MSKLSKRIKRRLYLESKHFYQDTFTSQNKPKSLIFIIGCQRSGTTMLNEIFEGDMAIRTYSEFSSLSSTNTPRLRLNPYPMVKAQIDKNHPKTVICKPLVESQNIDKLLDYFPNSKAIWAFRHYQDVAASNLKKFGKNNGIDDLRPIYEDDHMNWRAERISDSTREIVKKYFSEDMSPQDAAALFWYVRNVLFFERSLDSNERVFLCKYKNLVTEPNETMKKIYEFMDTRYPEKELVNDVHSSSVGKGRHFELSPEINQICEELWDRLSQAFEAQEAQIIHT